MKMWDRTHLFIAFNCYPIWTKFSACLVSCQTWMENIKYNVFKEFMKGN